MSKHKVTYEEAGVDIAAGNALVERIKPIAKATTRPEVQDSLGGFGGLFALDTHKYQNPLLVSCTDGVGTKLKLAIEHQVLEGLGFDLVAMCANDLIVMGAEPLFFLDYYATGKLELDTAEAVIASIGRACQACGMALLGGETAEMPGMYQSGEFDLAGFCVGVVEKDKLIDGKKRIIPGDQIIGLPSSGAHSNGYSLIRHLLCTSKEVAPPNIETLLAPTKLYVKPVLALAEQFTLHGLAHITGGGLLENIPRVLPKTCQALIETTRWELPSLFAWCQSVGNLEREELYKTFNCGIGFVIIASQEDTPAIIDALCALGEKAKVIGHINPCKENDSQVLLQ